jgi:photosystem II stability/assembly factor-like uncharacterized protein
VIELSTDGGRRWRDITPSNLVGDDPGARIAGFASVGPDNLWFAVGEASDVTSKGLRGFAVEHSADGGKTWTWAGVPGCAGCGSMSLSFVNVEDGWGVGDNGRLYATRDAGARWSLVARVPTAASGLAEGIGFTTTTEGWLTATPSLYATGDGGRRWRVVALPPVGGSRPARLGPPHFFTPRLGIVPAVLTDGRTVVYRTSDAGTRWSSEPMPATVKVDSPDWWVLPDFVVSSDRVWSLQSGNDLYVTADAGTRWTRVPIPPLYADDQPVWGFAMAKATSGWIDASAAPCTAGPRHANCGVPILLRTTDGGRQWRVITAPAA